MPNSTVHVDYTLVADQGTLTIGDATFTGESAYPEAMDYLRDIAMHLGNAVIVHSHDRGTGQDTLFSIDGHGAIAPVTGTVEGSSTAPSPWEASGAASASASAPPAPQSPPVGVAAPVVAPAVPTSVQAVAAAATEQMQPTRREARQSFLTQEQVEEPATTGFRGFLTRAGIRMAPSAAERRHREQVHLVSQHHVGPRTIMLANGKGGAGKTLATVCLSTVLTRHSGAATVAWDNNQTRGTLGWSTEAARHDASVLDLLPEIDRLLGTEARSADMAEYVHHQTRDRYDVLKSKPDILAAEQRFGAETVDRVHKVLTKFYRLVLIDSGNDETDPMWLAGLDRTDQLVVPTTTDDKWCESAALLLEQLMGAGGRYRELAENAVVIVGVETSDVKPEKVTEQVCRFKDAGLGRDVLTIPYDAGLKARIINFDALQESTKLAWLAAGAAVAKGL
ncbi:MinD/ParA family ATP-binding protein [Curtobacterium flaccumfaciens]|uniref:MinD/ParA family ATP-binding protein n=1 Tax=Curtobacterium flaccumfaciens TaxID=2035 RepID=UPI001BDE5C59|nr:AAA family ATPase [Curtobacterium flaccumfaciens]MBT1631502.1 AAA family ATPase [Curtobacterium flaccumfaciens pv. oortii]MCX2846810.1 AAA family ATPase [Curtobacterium flaccumfaciens pv. oortii]